VQDVVLAVVPATAVRGTAEVAAILDQIAQVEGHRRGRRTVSAAGFRAGIIVLVHTGHGGGIEVLAGRTTATHGTGGSAIVVATAGRSGCGKGAHRLAKTRIRAAGTGARHTTRALLGILVEVVARGTGHCRVRGSLALVVRGAVLAGHVVAIADQQAQGGHVQIGCCWSGTGDQQHHRCDDESFVSTWEIKIIYVKF